MSSEAFEIRAPRETVNDDVVTVLSWAKPDGSSVKKGELLAEIETSKAAIEMHAEADGTLTILIPAGKEVEVNEVIATISPDGAQATAAPKLAEPVAATTSADQNTVFSKRAQALIDASGVDVGRFQGRGMVREADVQAVLNPNGVTASTDLVPSSPTNGQLQPASDAFAEFKAAEATKTRGLLGDAKASSGHRGKSVLWLALNYVWRNWFLGLLVRVAPRGVILNVHRMRGVTIGQDCFIDPTAIVETAYPERIKIGNDVRVAAGAIVMTHIKAPHLLRESGAVPAVDRPVELRDHSFIGVNAVIMPGVVVGEGAVVSSGAVVLSDVEPYTMVAGNPAKQVRQLRPKP